MNRSIELVAWVVIPFEVILLTLLYRKALFNDAYTNLGCALLIYITYLLFGQYIALDWLSNVKSLALLDFGTGPLSVFLHILMGDFCFYVFHRVAHTPFFFLLDHNVHHSSKSFDYSTNLRVSFLAHFYSWGVLIIPTLLGFNPVILFASFLLANGVPFFLHNTRTKKLGWIEYVFNTPSHHRVHHGCNDCYINKNFGGMLIIWDRIFGTYAEEIEPVRYGIKGFESPKNPFKVLTQGWRILGLMMLAKCRNLLARRC